MRHDRSKCNDYRSVHDMKYSVNQTTRDVTYSKMYEMSESCLSQTGRFNKIAPF